MTSIFENELQTYSWGNICLYQNDASTPFDTYDQTYEP
jgi:hypothetical protein